MVRITRIGIGIALILLGLFLLVLPGPGILTIAAGLAVLAPEFEWAQRLLDWMKSRYRRYFVRRERSQAAPNGAADASLYDSTGSPTDDSSGGETLPRDHEGG